MKYKVIKKTPSPCMEINNLPTHLVCTRMEAKIVPIIAT